MRTATLGTKQIEIPESWCDLEYWQGAAIMNLYANPVDNLTYINHLLSILTKLSIDEIEELGEDEYSALLDTIYFENQTWLVDVPEYGVFNEGETPIDLPFFKDGYKLIINPIESEVVRFFMVKQLMKEAETINDAAVVYCSLIACYIDCGKPFTKKQIDELVPIIRKQPFPTTQRMAFFCLLDSANYVKQRRDAIRGYPMPQLSKNKQVLESSQSSTHLQ